MTKGKHTDGNWREVQQTINPLHMAEIFLGDGGGNTISITLDSKEELNANIKLVKAAPELLKELQKIRLDIKLGTISVREDSPIVKGIDLAINKATTC